MITIYLNNTQQLIKPQTLQAFLDSLPEVKPPVAIALNQQLVHLQSLETYDLQAGDSIDILVPMQGG